MRINNRFIAKFALSLIFTLEMNGCAVISVADAVVSTTVGVGAAVVGTTVSVGSAVVSSTADIAKAGVRAATSEPVAAN